MNESFQDEHIEEADSFTRPKNVTKMTFEQYNQDVVALSRVSRRRERSKMSALTLERSVKIFIMISLVTDMMSHIYDGKFVKWVEAGKSKSSKSKTTVIAIDGGGGGKMHPVPVPWPIVHCHHHHHHMKYVPKPVLVHHWVKKLQPYDESASMNSEKIDFAAEDKSLSSLNPMKLPSMLPEMPLSGLESDSSFPLPMKVRSHLEVELKKRQKSRHIDKIVSQAMESSAMRDTRKPKIFDAESDESSSMALSPSVPAPQTTNLQNELFNPNSAKPSQLSLEGNQTYMIDHSGATNLNGAPGSFQDSYSFIESPTSIATPSLADKPNYPFDASHDQLIDETRSSKVPFDFTKAAQIEENRASRILQRVSQDQASRLQALDNLNHHLSPFGSIASLSRLLIPHPPTMLQNANGNSLINQVKRPRPVGLMNLRSNSGSRLLQRGEFGAIDFMTKWAEHMAQLETKKILNNYKNMNPTQVKSNLTSEKYRQIVKPGARLFSLFSPSRDRRRLSSISGSSVGPKSAAKDEERLIQMHKSVKSVDKHIIKPIEVDKQNNAASTKFVKTSDQLTPLSSSPRYSVQSVEPGQKSSENKSPRSANVKSNPNSKISPRGPSFMEVHEKHRKPAETISGMHIEQGMDQVNASGSISTNSSEQSFTLMPDQVQDHIEFVSHPTIPVESQYSESSDEVNSSLSSSPTKDQNSYMSDSVRMSDQVSQVMPYSSGPATVMWVDSQQSQATPIMYPSGTYQNDPMLWAEPGQEQSMGPIQYAASSDNEIPQREPEEVTQTTLGSTSIDSPGIIEFPVPPHQWSVEALRSVNGEEFANQSNPNEISEGQSAMMIADQAQHLSSLGLQTDSGLTSMASSMPLGYQNNPKIGSDMQFQGPVAFAQTPQVFVRPTMSQIPSPTVSSTMTYPVYPMGVPLGAKMISHPKMATKQSSVMSFGDPTINSFRGGQLQAEPNNWYGKVNTVGMPLGPGGSNDINQLRQFQSGLSQSVSQANNMSAMINLTTQLKDQINNLQSRLPSMPNIPQPPQVPNIPMPPPGLMQMAGLALPFAMARATRQNNRFRNNQINGAAQGGGSNSNNRPGQRFFVKAATFTNRLLSQRRPTPTNSPPAKSIPAAKHAHRHRRRRFGPNIIRTVLDLSRPSLPSSAVNLHKNSRIIRPKIDNDSPSLLYEPKMHRSTRSLLWNNRVSNFEGVNEPGKTHHVSNFYASMPISTVDVDGRLMKFTSMTSPISSASRKILERQHHEMMSRMRRGQQVSQLPSLDRLNWVQPKSPEENFVKSDILRTYIGHKDRSAEEEVKTNSGPLVSNHINLLLFAAQNVTGPVVKNGHMSPELLQSKNSSQISETDTVPVSTILPDQEATTYPTQQGQDVSLLRDQSESPDGSTESPQELGTQTGQPRGSKSSRA